MNYTVIKLLHITFAAISISGFIARGLLMLRQSSLLQRRWLKVIPHINDSLLLLSAITLAILAGYNPLQHPWLAAKIILLFLYIGFGLMALRFARQRRSRIVFFILAIMTFAWIVVIAINKSVLFS